MPPFVDASCRREPDFESCYPSISALCRFRKFAPRLHPDDVIVYLTEKGRHGEIRPAHWRLVAILRVLWRFETHQDAAAWYHAQDLPVPKNCVVEGNPPISLEQTGGVRPLDRYGDPTDPERVVRRWDAGYRQRAKACGVFLLTEPLLIDLLDPVAILPEDLGIFGGRMPGTQNPPRIDPAVIDQLLELAGRRTNDQAA